MLSTITLVAALATQAPSQADLASGWTGWLYLSDGDVPARLGVEANGDGLTATIDLPVPGQYGIRLGSAERTDSGVVISHPSPENASIRMDLEFGGDGALRGDVDWMGSSGRASFHPTSEAIVPLDDERARSYVGVYGGPGADAIVVRARPWGELVVADLADGSARTIFAHEDGTLFTGSAMYVAREREQTFEFTGSGVIVRRGETERRLERRAIERRDIEVQRGDVRLRGTLTMPSGGADLCAVIAGGSDWTHRSQQDEWAYGFAALGVATVAYDKRGHGESSGEREVPFRTTADDLVAFAREARRTAGLEDARVGYLGLSRGGWYGALASASDGDAAFFVDLVGPAVSPIEQETKARLTRLADSGATEEELALASRYLESQWTFGRTGEGGEAYLELRREVEAKDWLGVLLGPRSLAPDAWQWLRWNGDFDPRETLRSIDAPVLAIYGSRDVAVSSDVNEPLMRAALGAPASRVVTLEGCDHGLRPVPATGRVERHEAGGRHADLWRTIDAWLRSIER